VNKQTRRGEMTSPKGRTRRTVPMTETLLAALKALDTIRTGFVIRTLDGCGMTDNETKYTATGSAGRRAYRSAGCTSCGTASGPTRRCSA
jgi:integrase